MSVAQGVLGLIRQRPLLYRVGRAIKGDRLILLDYPVDPTPRYGYGKPPHPFLHDLFDRHREAFRERLSSFLQFESALGAIPDEDWQNPYLPGLDCVALYSLLALHNPRTYVEVGSGYSTRFARRAVDGQKLQTKIVSIDPHPTAEIDRLCDGIIRAPLEDADLQVFAGLEPGDFVFLDGSHRCLTNSDVTVFFLDVLPRLKPGVVVHIHDIHLPYDYPPEWSQRFFSEQYLLATYLLPDAPRSEILLANWFVSKDEGLAATVAPLWRIPATSGALHLGSSFWMRTR